MSFIRLMEYRVIILGFCLLSTCYGKVIHKGLVYDKGGEAENRDQPHMMVKRGNPNSDELFSAGFFSDTSWPAYEDGSWNNHVELYAHPGEIIHGFNFTDALNMLGKMYNSENIRYVLNAFCSDAGKHIHRFLGADGNMIRLFCEEIEGATRHDRPIDDVEAVCEMIIGGNDDDDEGFLEGRDDAELLLSSISTFSNWLVEDFGTINRGWSPDHPMSTWSYFDNVWSMLGLGDHFSLSSVSSSDNSISSSSLSHSSSSSSHSSSSLSHSSSSLSLSHSSSSLSHSSSSSSLSHSSSSSSLSHSSSSSSLSHSSSSSSLSHSSSSSSDSSSSLSYSSSSVSSGNFGSSWWWGYYPLSSYLHSWYINETTSFWEQHYMWDTNWYIYQQIYHDAVNAFVTVAYIDNNPDDVCNYFKGALEWNNTAVGYKIYEMLHYFFENIMFSHACDCVWLLNSEDEMTISFPEEELAEESSSITETVDILEYLRVAFTFLGNFERSYDLCSVVIESTGFDRQCTYNNASINHDLLYVTVDNMVENVYGILNDAEVCEHFIDAFEQAGLPIDLEEIFGISDPEELCTNLETTMNDNMEFEFSENAFIPTVEPMVDIYSILSYLNFNQVIGIFSEMKREEIALESMEVLCIYLEDGFEYMGESIIPALCRSLREGNLETFTDTCREIVEDFQEASVYDVMPVDNWSYFLDHRMETHEGFTDDRFAPIMGRPNFDHEGDDFYHEIDHIDHESDHYEIDHYEDIFGQFVWDLVNSLYVIDLDYENAYHVCEFVAKTMEWDYDRAAEAINDVLNQFFVNVMYTRSYNCYDLVHSHEDEGHGDCVDCDDDDNDENEHDILDYIKEAFVFLGSFEDGYELCSTVLNYTYYVGINIDNNEAQLYSLAERFTNKLYEVIHTEAVCESFIAHFDRQGYPLPIEDITGYDSTALCRKLAKAMDRTMVNVDFDAPSIPEEIPSSFDLEDNFFNENAFLPYVTFDQFIGIIGEIKRKETGFEAYRVICNYLEPVRGYPNFGVLDEICHTIESGETEAVTEQCFQVLGPIYYGDFPIALTRPIEFEDMLNDMMDVVGYNEDLEICENIDNIINGDIPPKQMITEGIDVALENLWEFIVGVCGSWDFIKDMLSDDSSSSSQSNKLLEYGDKLIGIITGYGNIGSTCDAIVRADRSGETTAHDIRVRLRDRGLEIINNVERCTLLFTNVIDALNEFITFEPDESNSTSQEHFEPTFEYITGYDDARSLCTDLVYAMTQEQPSLCLGVVDCAGFCNGFNRLDCNNVCNGTAELDCASECGGNATLNECGECVGGRTGRTRRFGIDQCGNCIGASDYVKAFDCHGTCNGTAVFDKCRECVGGETNKPLDINNNRLDCRGVCDGDWVLDTCNSCEPRRTTRDVESPVVSRYIDCTGTCVFPGMDRAIPNLCGECVGGSTGRRYEYGLNECGECENNPMADVASCAGCDGVPNSGKETDACGVCGGQGNCVGIRNVVPNIIPPNQDISVNIDGAGFTRGSTLICVYTNAAGEEFNGDVTAHTSMTSLECMANLNPGSYTVHIQRNNEAPTEYTANLHVYNDVTIESVSPLEVTIDPRLYEQEVTIIATIQTADNDFSSIREVAQDYDVFPSILLTDSEGVPYIFPGDITSDTQITINLPVPSDSIRLSAYVSLNGVHGLSTANGQPFTLEAYYPAPELEHITFAPNGAGLIIEFSDKVHYEDFDSCNDVFENADRLGAGAECTWLVSTMLFALFGEGDNLLVVDDSLTLKANAVKAFRQELSRTALGTSVIQPPEILLRPKAVLSGSKVIPSCGIIKIDGRKSTGSGARRLRYRWSVTSSGDMTGVQAALDELNGMDEGNGAPVISLSGNLTDSDTKYEFELTVTNFLGQTDSASLSVYRSAVSAPQVKISVEGANVESVRISESFKLTAQVTFYKECVPPGDTLFKWSTKNSDVALDLRTMHSRTLYIPKNSLPGGQIIDITVKVYKSSNPDAFSSASLNITTEQSDLEARISGGATFMTVGRDSGTLQLEAEPFDPDNEARQWVYEWRCIQTDDNSACRSFNPADNGELFMNTANSNVAILEFDALALEADKTYKFTLIVSKGNRIAMVAVSIYVVNGNPPKIEIQPVGDTGVVKDDENIYITAFIEHSQDLTGVGWITTDRATNANETDYGFIDLQNELNFVVPPLLIPAPGGSVSFLGIKPNVVERGTNYLLSITVVQVDGQESTNEIAFTVNPGPTSCDVTIDDYEELSVIDVLITNCVTSSDAYPLSYQLFVKNRNENFEALTEATAELEVIIPGKPMLEGSNSREYMVKVCDTNEMCSAYTSNPTVSKKQEFTRAEEDTYREEQVTQKKYEGDYSGALRNLQIMLTVKNGQLTDRRRRRSVVASSTEDVAEQLELISLTIESSVLTASSSHVLLDQAVYVSVSEMSLSDQIDYISYLDTIVQVFLDDNTPVPTSSTESVLEKLAEIRANLDTTFNANIFASVASLQNKLMSSQAKNLALGEDPKVTSMSDVTTSVYKALLTGEFTSSASGTPATVRFGSQLESLYGGAWSCGSGTCSGVAVNFQHYADNVDYLSITDDDKNARASSVISIQLAEPDSGDEIDVSDLTVPITITIPLANHQSDVSYECRYWDTVQGIWSKNSLDTASISTTDVQCQTYHLSDFSVFAVPIDEENQYTTMSPVEEIEDDGDSLIIYIIVSVTAAVLLFLIIIVLVVLLSKKSGGGLKSTTKISPSPPPNHEVHQQPSMTQQQPQIQTVLQPIIIQQPYPVGVPPPANYPYSNPPVSPSAPAYEPNTDDNKKQSGTYSSYVDACTHGMAPVSEPGYPGYSSLPPPSSSRGSSPTSTGHC